MSACYVPVCFKKKHNARKAVWFTTATVIGAISAFVDSIDSHIILRMICESKMLHTNLIGCRGKTKRDTKYNISTLKGKKMS